MRLRWTHIVCLLGIVSIVGCSKDPGTVPVTGSVTLDGVPVEGASVILAGDEGKSAAGLTDKDGKFSLNCAAGLGALPGSYKVGITKTDPAVMAAQSAAAQGNTNAPDSADDPNAAYAAAEDAAGGDLFMGGNRTEVAAGDLLPAKYKNPRTSELTAEIKADGENVLPPFALTSK